MLVYTKQPYAWSTDAEFDLQQRLSRLPFYAPSGFGDVYDDLQTIYTQAPQVVSQIAAQLNKAPDAVAKVGAIIDKAGPYLDLIIQLLQDPALPLIMQRVQLMVQLRNARAAKKAAGVFGDDTTAITAPDLAKLLPYANLGVWYLKYPWAPWLIAGGGAVALLGVGFGVGRWTRKAKTTAPPLKGRSRRHRVA